MGERTVTRAQYAGGVTHAYPGAPAQAAAVPYPPERRRNTVAVVLGIVGVVLMALSSLLVVGILAMSLQNSAALVASAGIALIPLAFVFLTLWAIDRWEPEPPLLIILTVLWGAVGSILMTLFINEVLLYPIVAPLLGNAQLYEIYAIVIQAPMTEEFAKSIPLVVCFFFVRKYFDGPVDGVVVGGLSAAGFAFTENILYFGRAYLEMGDTNFIFFLRGIMSPLTHALFTAIGVGLALGLAARKSNRLWFLLAFPVGLGASQFLHALWNGSSVLVGGNMAGFFIFYLVVQVPLAIGAVLLVLLLRRNESRLTGIRLTEYANAGWFTHEEVSRLATGDGRLSLMRWANHYGVKRAMKRYIRDVTLLANNRQRAVTGRARSKSVQEEAEILADLVAIRKYMLARSGATVQQPIAGQRLAPVSGPLAPEQRVLGSFVPQQHPYRRQEAQQQPTPPGWR